MAKRLSKQDKIKSFDWYTYFSARKSSFDKHHREYDIDLVKGMTFGLKKVRTKHLLVSEENLEISFSVNEREVKSLLKKSRPYKGKIQGVNVTRIDLDRNLYKEIEIPPKASSIKKLYDYYNKKLFDGICPNIKIAFTTSTKTMAWVRFLSPTETKMVFNKASLISQKYLIDTLLHEMIHCYQHGLFNKYVKDGDTGKLQDIRKELSGKRHGGEEGHGKIFNEMMHKLNALGYDITLTETHETLVPIEVNQYVLLFFNTSGKSVYTGFSAEAPFDAEVESIVEELQSIYGPIFAYSYVYGLSEYSLHSTTIPLVKGKKLPRNVKLKWYKAKSDAVHKIDIIKDKVLESYDDPKMPINTHITRFNNTRYKTSFGEFALNVLYSYRGKSFIDDMLPAFQSGQANRLKIEIQNKLKPHDYDALWEAWNTVDADKMIKANNKVYRELCQAVWYLYKLEHSKDSPEVNHRRRGDLRHNYVTSNLSRINKDEFVKKIKSKLLKDYPIPENTLDSYLDEMVY